MLPLAVVGLRELNKQAQALDVQHHRCDCRRLFKFAQTYMAFCDDQTGDPGESQSSFMSCVTIPDGARYGARNTVFRRAHFLVCPVRSRPDT